MMEINIGHLYPDLLNLYGDRGNIQCLVERCKWRGINAKVKQFKTGDNVDFSDVDIILLGGGSDREQAIVCNKLLENKDKLMDYINSDGVLIAVCGGYQLLGRYYKTETEVLPGLGILDIYTEFKPGRLIGNIALKSDMFSMPIVGFENHGGRTYINDNKPLGKVVSGHGNNDNSGYEGVVYKNIIGTYLHGPLLPKNPEVADWLISRALKRKYNKEIHLEKIDDSLEVQANKRMYNRITKLI